MARMLRRAWLAGTGFGLLLPVAACSQLRTSHGGAACDEPAVCAPGGECNDHTRVTHNPTVHALASDLDHLEKHIDWYGSVTTKMPDVWGQARLTQYREDFDTEMRKDLSNFEVRINGAVSRADQSLFTYSQAISVAAAGTPGTPGSPGSPPPPPVVAVLDAQRINNGLSVNTKNKDGQTLNLSGALLDNGERLSVTQTTPQAGTPATPGTAPVPPNPTIPSNTEVGNVAATGDVTIERLDLKSKIKDAGLSLEPTLELAQKKRYLDFLAQLRRENEGSDTADAPGYQLSLIRLPVSVLPGKRTDAGHGAEVTFTIDPILGDDLLPTTFRRLVTNDLAQQLGLPLTEVLGDKELRDKLGLDLQKFVRVTTQINDYLSLEADPQGLTKAKTLAMSLCAADLKAFDQFASDELKCELLSLRGVEVPQCVGQCLSLDPDKPLTTYANPGPAAAAVAPPLSTVRVPDKANAERAKAFAKPLSQPAMQAVAAGRRTAGSLSKFQTPSLSFANGLDNKLSFPTSQLFDVYGEAALFEIAFGAKQALETKVQTQGYVHLPDVQAYLKEEMRAAYEFLRVNPQLLTTFCDRQLVADVRTRNVDALLKRRQAFRAAAAQLTGYVPDTLPPGSAVTAQQFRDAQPMHHSKTVALAWCGLVDSALLTDRLLRDVGETATAKGLAAPCPPDGWPQFFMPEPCPDARRTFNDYVRMRWPVYVFALDPMTQDQNVDDRLQTRRETQLALSVAFASGRIGTRLFTQYSRRLDAAYDTIALNRTQVGFANGENTFGWRFYPRFQTPPTQSNLTVLVRDQLIGGPGPDALLRQRRLEPGPRECVALVITPSFVPYLSIDTSSNWFGLANPKHKVLDHTQAVRMSKTVRALEAGGPTVTDADCYRDGELHRLQTRVRQLASRLPAQTLTVPVPIANTLGGFEMFSNGTTDLAPELYGWYGAPGVSATKDTTLFLVGDHFSPLQSRVIVGNGVVDKDGTPPAQRMLSRQVMQVTVAAARLVPLTADKKRYVQVHVATPYGVSRELLVPLVEEAKGDADAAPAAGYAVAADKSQLTIQYGVDGTTAPLGQFKPAFQGVSPDPLKLTWYDPLGQAPEKVKLQLKFEFQGQALTVPCSCAVTAATTGDKMEVVLDDGATAAVACELVRQIHDRGFLSLAANPLADGLTTSAILVTPVQADGHTAATVEAKGKLTIVFKAEGLCPAKVRVCPDICPPPPAVEVPKYLMPPPTPLASPAGESKTPPVTDPH